MIIRYQVIEVMLSGAAGSHLLIRTAYGSQDSAFALGLPLGLMPDRQRLSGGGW